MQKFVKNAFVANLKRCDVTTYLVVTWVGNVTLIFCRIFITTSP